MESKTKLLDHMRHVLRLKHLSIKAEKAYVQWAKHFILFHHQRRPADMGTPEIRTFLTHLAVGGQVAASTQNVVLQALIFLYRHVLTPPFPTLKAIEQARKSRWVPIVFARPPRAAAGWLLSAAYRPASLWRSNAWRWCPQPVEKAVCIS